MASIRTPTDGTDHTQSTTRRATTAKWGDALDAGFQIVPNVLIRGQAKLGLDALDLVILLNILMHWWEADELPFPQPRVIANRTGVSVRTVERRLESLEKRRLITRLAAEKFPDQLARRRIDLTGLVAKLQEFAHVNVASRRENASDIFDSEG